jgi:hypothetical protein
MNRTPQFQEYTDWLDKTIFDELLAIFMVYQMTNVVIGGE